MKKANHDANASDGDEECDVEFHIGIAILVQGQGPSTKKDRKDRREPIGPNQCETRLFCAPAPDFVHDTS